MEKVKLYVLIGLPASGKTTFAKNEFASDKVEILSSDEIRKELFNDETHQANNDIVFSTLYERAKNFLSAGVSVVIDATSINRFERKRVLSHFVDYDIERIAIYFNTPVKVCIERDFLRSRTVGRDVIYKYKRKFEFPKREEGFDKVMVVKNKSKSKIILASNNKHKIDEFKKLFPNNEILALKDIGFNDDIVEDGNSFFENAMIKAKVISEYLKTKGIVASVIADDSGLCVKSLNGEPGIYSARYAGEHNDKANRSKLLDKLKGVSDRKAYFNCTLVELFPNGEYITVEGKTYGEITEKEIGDDSFGFDCLFMSDDLGKTFGQATSDEKNSVSHRGRAIEQLKKLRKDKYGL